MWIKRTLSDFNPDHILADEGFQERGHPFFREDVHFPAAELFQIVSEVHEIGVRFLARQKIYKNIDIAFPRLFAAGKGTKDADTFHPDFVRMAGAAVSSFFITGLFRFREITCSGIWITIVLVWN